MDEILRGSRPVDVGHPHRKPSRSFNEPLFSNRAAIASCMASAYTHSALEVAWFCVRKLRTPAFYHAQLRALAVSAGHARVRGPGSGSGSSRC